MTKLTETAIEDFAIEQFNQLRCQCAYESRFQDQMPDKLGQLQAATKCSHLERMAI